MKFLLALIVVLATSVAHACYNKERLAMQDKIGSEYRMVHRELLAAKDLMQATNSREAASQVCQINRRQESLLREWNHLDSLNKYECPEFWNFSQSSGGSQLMRQNHEVSSQLIEACTRMGL